jgi:Tfp pilus assembly protein PilO
MILARRPLRLFDVDAIGAALLVALGAAGYVGLIEPMRSEWARLEGMRTALHTVRQGESQLAGQLGHLEKDVMRLRAAVGEHAARVPRSDALPQFLSQLVSLAESARLTLQRVTPQAARSEGQYVVGDVTVAASGTSLDFIRFLDSLSADVPYQSITRLSMTGPPAPGDARCAISWTLRLHMLPDESQAAPNRSAEPRDGGGGRP